MAMYKSFYTQKAGNFEKSKIVQGSSSEFAVMGGKAEENNLNNKFGGTNN